MKKLIFACALLGSVLLIGCGPSDIQRDLEETETFNSEKVDFSRGETGIKVNTVVIDSCEYLYAWFGSGNGGGSFTHKGNCNFCMERNHK